MRRLNSFNRYGKRSINNRGNRGTGWDLVQILLNKGIKYMLKNKTRNEKTQFMVKRFLTFFNLTNKTNSRGVKMKYEIIVVGGVMQVVRQL